MGNTSPQFHVGHDGLFETTMCNRLNTQAKSNWKKMSGIDNADTIKNKEEVLGVLYHNTKLIQSVVSCKK